MVPGPHLSRKGGAVNPFTPSDLVTVFDRSQRLCQDAFATCLRSQELFDKTRAAILQSKVRLQEHEIGCDKPTRPWCALPSRQRRKMSQELPIDVGVLGVVKP